MRPIDKDILAALDSDTEISKDTVVHWIDSAGGDLNTLSNLYRLTDKAYWRINPELGGEITCSLIQRYLLECIRQDVKDNEEIKGRWEAADTLHLWLRQLLETGETSALLNSAAKAITELFVASGEEVRDAIEMGFLEHALETAALRPYFENWSADPELRETWERALEWGKAHPDQMWNGLQEIRRISNQKTTRDHPDGEAH